MGGTTLPQGLKEKPGRSPTGNELEKDGSPISIPSGGQLELPPTSVPWPALSAHPENSPIWVDYFGFCTDQILAKLAVPKLFSNYLTLLTCYGLP